jgi:hypothetical protein
LGIVKLIWKEGKLMRRELKKGLNQLGFRCNVKPKKSKTKQKIHLEGDGVEVILATDSQILVL